METRAYTLKVGAQGQPRLEVLNEIYNPHSIQYLIQHGLQEDHSILDLGCGIGELSCQLTSIVGSLGNVHGVDNSEEQLSVARSKAEQRELSNIQFTKLAAEDLSDLGIQFDFIYARLLLCHVADPKYVLEQAKSLLKPGGKIVLEDLAGLSSFTSYPHSEAYEAWADAVRLRPKAFPADFEIGLKLPSILNSLGFTVKDARLIQPFVRTKREKTVLTLGTLECKERFLKAGVMIEEEIDKVVEDLKTFEDDDSAIGSYGNCMQVSASLRPAPSI